MTQGRTPTNISHKWTKIDVRRIEWGVRCWSWRPKSSSSSRKNEEIGSPKPVEMCEINNTNSPARRSLRGTEPARIPQAVSCGLHPSRRRTVFRLRFAASIDHFGARSKVPFGGLAKYAYCFNTWFFMFPVLLVVVRWFAPFFVTFSDGRFFTSKFLCLI